MPKTLEFWCKNCNGLQGTRVTNSWHYGPWFVRRRTCLECKAVLRTYEGLERPPARGKATTQAPVCLACKGTGSYMAGMGPDGEMVPVECECKRGSK